MASEWLGVDWATYTHEREVQGRVVRYVDYGEGRTIVHGLGGAWTNWLENLPALGRRHRVLAVDLPGFGGSAPLPSPGHMTTHAGVLAELIAALDAGPVIPVGHSLGGAVSVRLASDFPALIHRLVIVDGGSTTLRPWQLAMLIRAFRVFNAVASRTRLLEVAARRRRLRRILFRGFMADPDSMSPELALQTVPLAAAPGFVDALIAASGEPDNTDFKEIGCPTLVIWGSVDRLVPVATAHMLGSELPDARVEIFDGIGHCPNIEAPDRFQRVGAAFRRGLTVVTHDLPPSAWPSAGQ